MKKMPLILSISLMGFALLMGSAAQARPVYITKAEIADLERSGHIVPAGTDAWRTRGGLILKGRDPDGLTRLEHIMRHTRDIPNRKKHSVFLADKKGVIELLDFVWEKIRSGKLKGKEGGGRVVYTWRGGKAYGYPGGREGKGSGDRELSALRLVLKKDTPEVVTFFPF